MTGIKLYYHYFTLIQLGLLSMYPLDIIDLAYHFSIPWIRLKLETPYCVTTDIYIYTEREREREREKRESVC